MRMPFAARAERAPEPAPPINFDEVLSLGRRIIAEARPPTAAESDLIRRAAESPPDAIYGGAIAGLVRALERQGSDRAQQRIADGYAAAAREKAERAQKRLDDWRSLPEMARRCFIVAASVGGRGTELGRAFCELAELGDTSAAEPTADFEPAQ